MCPYCNKSFKASGLQGHITAKHMYDLWKATQAAKASR